MSYETRAVIILGWEAEELRRTLQKYRESNTMSKFADQIKIKLDEVEHIRDYLSDEFLYIGKIISDKGIDSLHETIFIDELDFKELEREAYEEAEKVKEFWKPTNSPKLIHFCYVR